MGISRLTASAIHHNPEVFAKAYREADKFGGFIECICADESRRVLVSTQPVYGTEQDAVAEMQTIIDDIKAGPDPFAVPPKAQEGTE